VYVSTGLDKGKPLKKSLIQLQPARDLNPEPPEFDALATHLRCSVVPLPSRTQSLKAAIVFGRDVTVKASSKNELNLQNLIKTVKFLVSTFFFSRTICLGFTITASWSKMSLMT
jgi:hypothetical protein